MYTFNSSGGMRVPACHGARNAVNHTAPSIQSAMPAETTAAQFKRIASPLLSVRGDNILFRGFEATFDATRASVSYTRQPIIQSAMAAETTAAQFKRIASPFLSARGDNILFRGFEATFDATRA